MANEAPVLDPKTGQPAGTPPPVTPPPAKKEEPKPLNKEQLEGVQKFASQFLPEKFAAPKVETAEEKAAREKEEKAKADRKKADKEKADRKKAAAARRPAETEKPLNAEAIAEAAARGVATALKPKEDETKAKEKEQAPELTESQKRKVAVLAQMEKMAPDKYKGIADRFKTSTIELKKYADKWENEHPGQEFNEEDAEHEEFFNRNNVDWEDDDYTEALADMKAQTAVEEERKKTNERLSKFERAEKLRESQPEIAKSQIQPARLIWNQFGKDFSDVVSPEGQLNMEKLVELRKADPVAFDLRAQAANALNAEVAELYKTMNGLVDYDAKNPIHLNIGNFAMDEEKRMAEKPLEDRLNEKQQDFLPAAEYWKLPKAKREEYWTFSVNDLAALRAADLAVRTNKIIESEEKRLSMWAESRGFTKGEKASTPPPAKTDEIEEPPEPADDKPHSPQSGSESRMTATRRAAGNAQPDPLSVFMDRQLGKK